MTLIIIGVGGVKVIMGTLTLGSLYAIKSYADSFLEPIMRLLEANLSLKKASISLERVYGILLRTIADSYIYECKEVVYPIALEDICYSYDSKTVVLKNVNYKILLNTKNSITFQNNMNLETTAKLTFELYYNEKEIETGDKEAIDTYLCSIPKKETDLK